MAGVSFLFSVSGCFRDAGPSAAAPPDSASTSDSGGTSGSGGTSAPGETSAPGGTSGSGGASGSGEDGPGGAPDHDGAVPVSFSNEVDVLFVVDNSFSMGEEQGALARALSTVLAEFERDEAALDYRIAVTTTDNGAVAGRCGPPNAGALKLSSCKTRLEQFQLKAQSLDKQRECLDVCAHDELQTLPTAVEPGGDKAPRPWVERTRGRTNLPAEDINRQPVTPESALECILPQGIAGCAFEQPLESMSLALRRSSTMGDPAFGFLRPHAALAVIFISDETDCSMTPAGATIVDPSSRVFWSDKTLPYATSAVCWNAGVSCSGGDADRYDACAPANFDAQGNVGADDDDAMLYPVSRYLEQLSDLQAAKQQQNPNARIVLSLITGVPVGYESGTKLVYRRGIPGQGVGSSLVEYGVEYGCNSDMGRAVPPVRELAVAAAWNGTKHAQGNVSSICVDDLKPTMSSIAATLARSVKPGCFSRCAADLDPSTATLDPECKLVAHVPDAAGNSTAIPVPSCAVTDQGFALPDAKTDFCTYLRTDRAGATPAAIDDLRASCQEGGSNVEFALLQRDETAPLRQGVTFTATCELSSNPAKDCPGL